MSNASTPLRRTPRGRRLILLPSILLMAAIAIPARAIVPTVISYQGKLMQPTGQPVADGTVSMTFTIYDAANAVKWTEFNPSVAVKGGLFNVMLGGVSPLPASAFDGGDRYLGIKVGTDSELVPRQKVATTAYAQFAGNGTPFGGIIMWSGAANAIPAGWALCDGTNGTPNLVGQFVIGAGPVDPYTVGKTGGAPSVTLSVAQLPSHTHGVNDPGHSHSINDPGHVHYHGQGVAAGSSGKTVLGPDTGVNDKPTTASTTGISINGAATGISIQATGSGQPVSTLPPFYALCFIMKTAN